MKRRTEKVTGRAPTEHTYTVVIHPAAKDERGFWSEVPALPGCNSQGNTYEETVANTRLAIEGYLRMLRKSGRPIPVEKQPKSKVVASVRVAV
jgi:predicted RNase H-like HicB family nuclease